MARGILTKAASVMAACAFLLQLSLVLGNLECEDLTADECAFAVASSGARCVLEKSILQSGEAFVDCQTSTIIAGRPTAWIESNECIKACGVEREAYGLSTDALMESGFADKVCSAECQNSCPNIVDLYLKLAAGEGVYLPRLCMESRSRARRLISERLVRHDPRRKRSKRKQRKHHPNQHYQSKSSQDPDDSKNESLRSLSSLESAAAEYASTPSSSPSAAEPTLQTGTTGTSSSSDSDHTKKTSNTKVVSTASPPGPSYEVSEITTLDDDHQDGDDIYNEIVF